MDVTHVKVKICLKKNTLTVSVVQLRYCDCGVASKQTRHPEGWWYFLFMMGKAKVPTCSCPSARNMKQEQKMQDRVQQRRDRQVGRRSRARRGMGLKNKLVREAWVDSQTLDSALSEGDT